MKPDVNLDPLQSETRNSPQTPVNRRAPGSDRNRDYRKTRKPTKPSQVVRTWRTRRDPFLLVWDLVEARLEANPELPVKEIFETLERDYPGQFRGGQLRTLQRRVRAWRLARIPSGEGSSCEGVMELFYFPTPAESSALEGNSNV